MTEPSSLWVFEYDVWSDREWWYARRILEITPEQHAAGVRREVRARTFNDLKRECVAQPVLAARHAT